MLLGIVGVLSLMGAFGPVTCVTESAGATGSASADGTETVRTTTEGAEQTRECTAGIDYLFGDGGGNAAALFFWPLGLLGLVAVGGAASWTGRTRLTWLATGVGAVVSIIGVMSIGLYFLGPTICLAVGATALTVADPSNDD